MRSTGGSGGAVAVASIHDLAVEIVFHEIGHSFALLADEYWDSGPPFCVLDEPWEVNATRQTDRALIKWKNWIDQNTPIPTRGSTSGVPGLYEGAKYCANGLYRPTNASKMRFLNFPFEQINSEQLIKRIYNLVSPLDSVEPPESSLTLSQGNTHEFRVTVPAPLTHALDVSWTVDGDPAGNGTTFTLDSSLLALGNHVVEVVVNDSTPMVRTDSEGLLNERRGWTVTVRSGHTNPGDFDGDGKSDVSVFRPSNGTWYIMSPGTGIAKAFQWGNWLDVPVPGDYDGDGQRRHRGLSAVEWHVVSRVLGHGNHGGCPMGERERRARPGDYDGDGKTDIAVFRPADGTWYLVYPATGTTAGVQWGNGLDIPVPGDYDGDGQTDIAVFRPSNGTWYLVSATGSTAGVQWGNGLDVPVPGTMTATGKPTSPSFARPMAPGTSCTRPLEPRRVSNGGTGSMCPCPGITTATGKPTSPSSAVQWHLVSLYRAQGPRRASNGGTAWTFRS